MRVPRTQIPPPGVPPALAPRFAAGAARLAFLWAALFLLGPACTNEVGVEPTPLREIDVDSLDFGSVQVGSFADRRFTVFNRGTAPLTGRIRESCEEFTVTSGLGPYGLAPGDSLVVVVRFLPLNEGTSSCGVEVVDGVVVPCVGTGLPPPPSCSITPPSLDFGNVEVGSSAQAGVVIRNSGGGEVSGVLGDGCGDFTVLDAGGAFALAAGESLSVRVRFAPTAPGPQACAIPVEGEACGDIPCSGNGVPPGSSCSLSRQNLDFGVVALGESSTQSFEIENGGPGDLSGDVQSACPEFAIDQGGGFFVLGAGESRLVVVRFAPSQIGTRSCLLDLGAAGCASMPCVGFGEAPPICEVVPDSLDFGSVRVGGFQDRIFTVRNIGDGILIGMIAEACAPYAVVSGGGSYQLRGGESRVVTVRFSPSAPGRQSCVITTGEGCPDVPCVGTGISQEGCDVQPTQLAFGSVNVGDALDRSFTITNTGESPISGVASEDCEDFSIVGDADWVLDPGGQQTIVVRFAPSGTGPQTCTILTGHPLCADVVASGDGFSSEPACALEPVALDFGTVTVGDFLDRSFTLRNTGGGVLQGTVSEACPEFDIISGDGDYALAGGEARTVIVRFAPLSAGPKNCTIETGSLECADVPCTGTGEEPPPLCVITPGSLDFGDVEVGQGLDLPFTIRNDGGGILAGTVSEACPEFSVVGGGGAYALGPDQEHVATIRFAPATEGLKSCTIETGDAACADLAASGTGVLAPAACALRPATLDFGQVLVGDSKDLSFWIVNVGGSPFSGNVNAGACPADFSILAGGGAYDLPAGDSVEVVLRFAPTSPGEQSCTVETGSELCSDLVSTGIGLTAGCLVEPASLDFGDVLVGGADTLSFRIVNTGNTQLSGTVSELCLSFSLVGAPVNYSLGPGEERIVQVRFAPNASGPQNCTIETGSALCADVACSGTGIGPICFVEPDTLDFGGVQVGQSADRSFTIRNAGGGTLTGSVSEACAEFAVVAGGGAYALGPGEERAVTVRFSPASAGLKSCTIETGSALCADVLCTGTGLSAECLVEPISLDFGDVLVGDADTLSFRIVNTGNDQLSGNVSESCQGFSLISGGGNYNLGPGQERIVRVRFAPNSPGPKNCTIETGSTLCGDVLCSGTAIGPICVVEPDTLDFGGVEVGQSADRSFTITNAGGGTLTGNVSESCAEFAIVSGGGSFSLDAQESKTVTVRYQPGGMGEDACTIETGDALCADVACTGTGLAAACLVEPSNLAFGDVLVGGADTLSFRIANTGNAPLSGTVSESCPDFSLVSGAGAYVLGPGEERIVQVRFAPGSPGPQNCTIETGSALCADVACSGTGIGPICAVVPDTLDFGGVEVGQTADLPFTIRNDGGGTLSGSVSSPCAEFTVVGGGGAYALGPGQERAVTIRFAPASAGPKNCTIETGNAICTDVACLGEGTTLPPSCLVSPTQLDFGDVEVGQVAERAFTIQNTGGGTLTGSVIETCPDFSLVSGGGPFSLGAGQQKVVTVQFAPETTGPIGCPIDTGTDLCADVICTGIGTPGPSCVVEPGTLAFGDVEVGQSLDLPFTIRNDGGGTLAGTVSSPCAEFTVVGGGGAYALGPGQEHVATIRFAPPTEGLKNCTIETGNEACVDLAASGTGVPPPAACVLRPAALDFGQVLVGDSKDLSFWIVNVGGSPFSGTVSAGACPADFSLQAGGGAYDLPAGDSLEVVLRFAPTSPGEQICTVETGSDLCGSLAARGEGTEAPPLCVVEPTALDFGAVPIGLSADLPFKIRNTGGGTLTGSVGETCTDYSIVSGEGAFAIPAGDSLTVTVRFAPLVEQPPPCTIETGTEFCADVACSGTGIGPICAVLPSTLDFGGVEIGQSADLPFTIRNDGGGTLAGTVSSPCPEFTVIAGGEAYALGAGQEHAATIRFTPATEGLKNCTIETGNGACVDLAAIGTGCPVCPTSPLTINVLEDVTIIDGTLGNCTEDPLRVGGDMVDSLVTYEALLLFDLSDIPATAVVTGVTLEFFAEGCGGALPPESVDVELADLASFVDPCSGASAPERLPLVPLCSSIIECNQNGPIRISCDALRSLCQQWVTDPSRNYGLALRAPTAVEGYLLVQATEGHGASTRLSVSFTCPCP